VLSGILVQEGGEMMTCFGISSSGITECPPDLQGGHQIAFFSAPDERDRSTLRKQFGLDDYDLSSTGDPDEVPRVEISTDRTFIVWKVPKSAKVAEALELGVRPVSLALVADRLAVVMSEGDISFAAREFRNCGSVRDILLGYLLHTVRHFVGHLRVIKQLSSDLEKKITVSMENRHLLQMFALSESLVYYIDAIEGNGVVLAKLHSIASDLGLDTRQRQLLDDIILENGQAARQANIYSSVLSGLMDARGTIVNNNMNVLLKNLTLINIVFLPLNLIASIGGMSEWTMMTGSLDWRVSYSLFLLGTGVLGWLLWIFVTRFIDRRDQGRIRNPT
jgi:magnesium transporter